VFASGEHFGGLVSEEIGGGRERITHTARRRKLELAGE